MVGLVTISLGIHLGNTAKKKYTNSVGTQLWQIQESFKKKVVLEQ